MPLDYVIITPARNEAAFIRRTLESVAAQSHVPLRWVVVSDGSTDGTDEQVREFQRGRPWLQLLRLPTAETRNFGAKARAFAAGYEAVRSLAFEVVANVDADVSFESDFAAFLLGRFAADPRLGVAGTDYVEGGFHSFRDSYINAEHVNGQCQFFRRACYEQIGGYQPIPGGGIDWVAVTTARMRGWGTRSFSERLFHHHRKMGTAERGPLRALFRDGLKDHALGGHPLWEICRAAFQLKNRPWIAGGSCLLAGYAWGTLTRRRSVSEELMSFHRYEQMLRLKQLASGRFALGAARARP